MRGCTVGGVVHGAGLKTETAAADAAAKADDDVVDAEFSEVDDSDDADSDKKEKAAE